MNLKSKKLTESIIKVFYNVYNQLGYGFLEKIGENTIMRKVEKKVTEQLHYPRTMFFIAEDAYPC